MNIEIANRLVELRKKSGLSQEQLAEKLGLSRQAVSKWERAEASPDTDNLICLAKLYNVSLDDLVKTDQSIDEIVQEQIKDKEDAPEAESAPEKEDDDDDDFHWERTPEEQKRRKTISVIQSSVTGALFVIAAVLYITFGALYDNVWPYPLVWPIGWVVFLIVPMISTIFDVVKTRKVGALTGFFALGSVVVFMILGMGFDLWHPGWIVFLSIPIVGIITGNIDRATHDWRHRNDTKVPGKKQ